MTDSPRIYLLAADETPVVVMDNTAPEALHYFDDTLHTYLTIGGASTLAFTVDSTHPDSRLIEPGMKVSFQYNHQDYYFTITGVDRDETDTTVTSDGLSFEFLNEDIDKYEAPREMTFLEYLDAWGFERAILKYTRNDIPTVKKKLKFDSRESVLKRLSTLADRFGVEVRLEPKLTHTGALSAINVQLCLKGECKGVGVDRTKTIIRWGEGPESVRKTSDLTDFCSRIRGLGKTERVEKNGADSEEKTVRLTGYTPASQATDPDGYTYIIAGDDICCPQARDRYPSSLTKNPDGGYIDGYVVKFFEDSGCETQEQLYLKCLEELRKRVRPKVSYEIKGVTTGDIGDWLTVEDAGYSPTTYYRCRMIEKEVRVSNGDVLSVKLDNFTEMSSKLSQTILSQIQQELDRITTYDCRIVSADSLVMDDDGTAHTFAAAVRKGAEDVAGGCTITWTLNGTAFTSESPGEVKILPEDTRSGANSLAYTAAQNGNFRGSAEVTLTASPYRLNILAPQGAIMDDEAPHTFTASITKGAVNVLGTCLIRWKLNGSVIPTDDPRIIAPASLKLDPTSLDPGSTSLTCEAVSRRNSRVLASEDLTLSRTVLIVTDGEDGATITINEHSAFITKGAPGEDGFSPVVSLSKSGKTSTLKVTDKNGDHTTLIQDGADGADGADGKDGKDGAQGPPGEAGVGISSITMKYCQSSSSTSPAQTSSSWSTSLPYPTAGYYLHTQIAITLTSGTTTYFYLKSRNGSNGTTPTVVNNLTSTSTTSALSAAQGKALRALIDGLQSQIDEMKAGSTAVLAKV